jgi:hypothetical protein
MEILRLFSYSPTHTTLVGSSSDPPASLLQSLTPVEVQSVNDLQLLEIDMSVILCTGMSMSFCVSYSATVS